MTTQQPVCPTCGKDVIEFSFAQGKSQWYHLIDGIPQPSSPACAPPSKEEPVKKAEQSEEDRFEAIQSALMPEANYHYNAMKAMEGLKQPGVSNEEAVIMIQASQAWSQMGLLRAKVREAGK